MYAKYSREELVSSSIIKILVFTTVNVIVFVNYRAIKYIFESLMGSPGDKLLMRFICLLL